MRRQTWLIAALAALVAVPAAGQVASGHFYDVDKEVRFEGTVREIVLEPRYKGTAPFVVLRVEDSARAKIVTIEVSPSWFFSEDVRRGKGERHRVPFQMGAVLEIEKDGKKMETELLRKKVGEQIEFTLFESKEMNLKIELENLAAGVIDIAFSAWDGSETQTTTTQTETNEVLSVTASIKPFVNLVWAGVAIMVIGFFIAMTRRLKESKIIS